MEKNKSNNKLVVLLLAIIIVILSVLCVLFATGKLSFNSNFVDTNKPSDNSSVNDNANDNNGNTLSSICTVEEWDSNYLKDLPMSNKTETINAMGGGNTQYKVTTTVTKNHNYTSTPENEELYAIDMFDTLYILYNGKLYYTSQADVVSKYCGYNGYSYSSCDYSKINNNTIKEFNAININLSFKAIGSYGNGGSGSPYPYAITTDGRVISMPNISSRDYNSCGILYDSSEYPIDRILKMNFYDGVEYTILLKDGTLITRDVDYENSIKVETK